MSGAVSGGGISTGSMSRAVTGSMSRERAMAGQYLTARCTFSRSDSGGVSSSRTTLSSSLLRPKTEGASNWHIWCPWQSSRSAVTFMGTSPPLDRLDHRAPPVANLRRAGELDHHLRGVVGVGLRGLRHLEGVVTQ